MEPWRSGHLVKRDAVGCQHGAFGRRSLNDTPASRKHRRERVVGVAAAPNVTHKGAGWSSRTMCASTRSPVVGISMVTRAPSRGGTCPTHGGRSQTGPEPPIRVAGRRVRHRTLAPLVESADRCLRHCRVLLSRCWQFSVGVVGGSGEFCLGGTKPTAMVVASGVCQGHPTLHRL